jgi:hypothetical protein
VNYFPQCRLCLWFSSAETESEHTHVSAIEYCICLLNEYTHRQLSLLSGSENLHRLSIARIHETLIELLIHSELSLAEQASHYCHHMCYSAESDSTISHRDKRFSSRLSRLSHDRVTPPGEPGTTRGPTAVDRRGLRKFFGSVAWGSQLTWLNLNRALRVFK